jgi:hypothetical protein
MANLAMLLEDGQYVPIEGRSYFVASGLVASPVFRADKQSHPRAQQNQARKSRGTMHYGRFYNAIAEPPRGEKTNLH